MSIDAEPIHPQQTRSPSSKKTNLFIRETIFSSFHTICSLSTLYNKILLLSSPILTHLAAALTSIHVTTARPYLPYTRTIFAKPLAHLSSSSSSSPHLLALARARHVFHSVVVIQSTAKRYAHVPVTRTARSHINTRVSVESSPKKGFANPSLGCLLICHLAARARARVRMHICGACSVVCASSVS